MSKLLRRLRHLPLGTKGQGMVEYGLIIGFVSIILLGTLILFGNTLGDYMSGIASALPVAS